MSCPVVDMDRPGSMGKAFTTTLDRFGHNQSGGEQLMHAMHTSGHAVRQFYGEGQVGWAAPSARVCPDGEAFLRLLPRVGGEWQYARVVFGDDGERAGTGSRCVVRARRARSVPRRRPLRRPTPRVSPRPGGRLRRRTRWACWSQTAAVCAPALTRWRRVLRDPAGRRYG